jgi:hypothetical protein
MTSEANDVTRARAALTANLDAIEDKVNVPKRMKRSLGKASDYCKAHPTQTLAGAVGAAGAVAGSVWLIVKLLSRR